MSDLPNRKAVIQFGYHSGRPTKPDVGTRPKMIGTHGNVKVFESRPAYEVDRWPQHILAYPKLGGAA